MNKKDIIDSIEKIINSNEDLNVPFSEGLCQNSVDRFYISTARRLIKCYKKYLLGKASTEDYLVSLRNFLLVFQCPIEFDNNEIIMDNEFGIHKNSDGKIFASLELPNNFRDVEFVQDVFVPSDVASPHIDDNYNLFTNQYIRDLTGNKFQRYKSIHQKIAVHGALNTPKGYTTLISLPTGGGKSLITQSVAFSSQGLTIVVIPTVSLLINQEKEARATIKQSKKDEIFCYYSGTKNAEAIFQSLKDKKCRLLFISPEALLKNANFRSIIQDLNESAYLKNIIIDEAHIVASWGDFFRPDFQCLEPWRKKLIKTNPNLRTYLLSATFSNRTTSLLKKMFGSETNRWIEIRCDSLRKEPRFIVLNTNGVKEKTRTMLEMAKKLPRPMIIYVRNPFEAREVKKTLMSSGFLNIEDFTGETKSKDRERIIDSWLNDELDLIVATSAFGVGVSKPDIRTVLHLYIPESPDSYYQELGRGGRDGLPSLSVMCINGYNNTDINKGYDHVGKVLTTNKFLGRWETMLQYGNSHLSGGLREIDTSIKPNYSLSDSQEEGNETHEKWNINVLLMLRKYDCISIEEVVQRDDGHYSFIISIKNNLIETNSEKRQQLFDEIRDTESKENIKNYDAFKNVITEDPVCWSEIFCETYSYALQFCAGCGNHRQILDKTNDDFALANRVDKPLQQISQEADKYFGVDNEVLVVSSKMSHGKILKHFSSLLPDVVITNEDIKYEDETVINFKTNVMDFKEAKKMHSKGNLFYTTGLFIVFYDSDYYKEMKIVKNILKIKQVKVIHVFEDDYYIDEYKKYISEMIMGSKINL